MRLDLPREEVGLKISPIFYVEDQTFQEVEVDVDQLKLPLVVLKLKNDFTWC
jgi:hypothetical protein